MTLPPRLKLYPSHGRTTEKICSSWIELIADIEMSFFYQVNFKNYKKSNLNEFSKTIVAVVVFLSSPLIYYILCVF